MKCIWTSQPSRHCSNQSCGLASAWACQNPHGAMAMIHNAKLILIQGWRNIRQCRGAIKD
jgi:hypothetical protein